MSHVLQTCIHDAIDEKKVVLSASGFHLKRARHLRIVSASKKTMQIKKKLGYFFQSLLNNHNKIHPSEDDVERERKIL